MRNRIVSAIRWLVVKAGLWGDVLQAMQCECSHPLPHVAADILEGDYQGEKRDVEVSCGGPIPTGVQVNWCRLCGAYCVETENNGAWVGHWIEPRAAWWESAANNGKNIADVDFADWPREAQNRFLKWLMNDEPAGRC